MKLQQWFEGLQQRERLMVILGAAAFLLLMLYLMIWEPMFSRYHNLKSAVAEQQESLAWMQQSAGQIKALQGSSSRGNAQGLGGRSLLSVVDQSARSGGLGGSIKRIEPDSNKGVKIWFEGASFDQMIIWLGNLTRQYQVETNMVTIEPQGGGRVNARISLLEPVI
ncbi:MAG: type II secretion system protein M [Gammaproteobacteria bacterium]